MSDRSMDRPATLDAVLFDLDGVLVRSEPAWLPLVRQTARAFGAPPPTDEAFAASFGQGVDADVARFYPGVRPEAVAAFYEAHFAEHRDRMEVDPEAGAVLAAVRDRGLAHAVVTNTPTGLARAMLDAAGLSVPVVVGAGDAWADKPAPDMPREALRRLDASPARALLVGDSRYDREAAAAAGLWFVGYGLPGDARVERLGELVDML